MRAIGWHVRDKSSPQILLDTNSTERWQISRFWLTPAKIEARPLPVGTVRAIIGVDGEALVNTPSKSLSLKPRCIIVFEGDIPLSVENEIPWACFFWQVETPALRQRRFHEAFERPLPLSDHYWPLLAAISNVLSIQNSAQKDIGSVFLVEMIGNALTASIASAMGYTSESFDVDENFYTRALQIIDERHRDPAFGAAVLAQILAISVPYVYRIFSEAGTTPAQEIEKRRASTALILLAKTTPRNRNLEVVARDSGFTTVRRMKSALQRQTG